MIREKIEQRLEGGPAGLRRAFKFFDKDGSGSINYEEFSHALKVRPLNTLCLHTLHSKWSTALTIVAAVAQPIWLCHVPILLN
eukprot:SAG31_NODE_42473_length_271_cov_0.906977_1_plen_82_part_10